MTMPGTTDPNPVSAPSAPRQIALDLAISGMTCANCVRHVREALQSVPGVDRAVVSLEQARATVRWKAAVAPDVPAVLQAVAAEGYGARLLEGAAPEHGATRLAGWQLNLWLGLPVTAMLMIGEWVLGLGQTAWFQWVAFVAAAAVQLVAGARFYRGAWGQLKAGSSNMDTLVALGSSTAFGYSVWALLSGQHGHVYFMEAAGIITLISLGHWLEALVSLRASSAVRQLLDLAPALARRRGAHGSETEIPVAELQAGEWVVLRPGDHVPTDGRVVEGGSAMDESMLTGESAPVEKAVGSDLFAGTVNLNGRLVMRVTATGADTALAQIIAAVQRAQDSRANIQRLADRVSSIFVPLVVAVAIAAALWWGLGPASARHAHEWAGRFLWPAHTPAGTAEAAFVIAAAVLIIACPCAMGLATPAAIMAGANAAARRGILIRDGVALEKAGRITTVVFDKTGTLTVGKPSVARVWDAQAGSLAVPTPPGGSGAPGTDPAAGVEPGDPIVFRLAAALARHSSHPISQALAKLPAVELELAAGEEIRGAGVQAEWRSDQGAGRVVQLGSLRWLRESGVDLAPATGFIDEWSGQGATIVGLAADARLLGLFAVQDTVKSGARAVVELLRRQGLKTCLVTGDNPRTAASIASQAGLTQQSVFAEVRPEQKAEFVRRLQQAGERVAFVGDGINDAPALEQADLGIAVSRASDVAREAADLILLKSEIEAVPEGLGLARATLRTIKQNLFWAFFYNALGIPLAALGFMSPILCAAAMGVSDLIVLGNALRLRWWRG